MEKPFTFKIAEDIFSVYIPSYHFPSWVLTPSLWNDFEFDKTVVYYDAEDDFNDVKLMVQQREPCNISMRRIYFEEKMNNIFGWKLGAYKNSTVEKLMPNIAILNLQWFKTNRGFENSCYKFSWICF